jgi:sigma-B regulation protein RsbU (phosphoserine phosphatase)
LAHPEIANEKTDSNRPGRKSAREQLQKSAREFKSRARRSFWRWQDGWRRLTEGMEIEELWNQFKTEAKESSRLYKQDVDRRSGVKRRSVTEHFKVFRTLLWSVLRRLSPARRIFLLLTMVLAIFSVIGIHFLFLTQEVEFLLAFGGLLVLLVLVLGDHISMKRDIEIAREIQRWLVPRKAPSIPGVDISFATRPAKTIGGDYYDVFRRSAEGRVLIVVADVSGKSVPAAILMATFQAALRALASGSATLAELLAGLNRQVCANSRQGNFTTAFVAELDPATGDLTYLCAGHNPPVLKREDGTFELLRASNLPLGVEILEEYKSTSTQLGPRDLLVVYTDGITEARNEDGEEFGQERLLSLLQMAEGATSELMLGTVMRDLDNFVGAALPHDDLTCMVVYRT